MVIGNTIDHHCAQWQAPVRLGHSTAYLFTSLLSGTPPAFPTVSCPSHFAYIRLHAVSERDLAPT